MNCSDLYTKLQILGQGSYGIVYKAQNQQTKEIVAMKEIKLQSKDEGMPAFAIREIALLKELKNDNIVKLYDVIHSQNSLTLIFEYCDYDLKRYMEQYSNHLPKEDIIYFSYQILNALRFIHNNNIMHRDVKPQNLLIKQNKELKLADFGLARSTFLPMNQFSTEVITQWYRPPEILLNIASYDFPIDIWSAGCVIAEMVTGHPLFPCQNNQKQIIRIAEIFGIQELDNAFPDCAILQDLRYTIKVDHPLGLDFFFPGIGNDLLELLKLLLQVSPHKRISAEDALKLPIFMKYHH